MNVEVNLTAEATGRVHTHNGTVLVHAARALGVDVNSGDIDYFKATSRLAAYVDDVVDTLHIEPDVQTVLDSEAQSLTGYYELDDIKLMSHVISGLSDNRRLAWLSAERLPYHNERKKAAADMVEYKDALKEEAALFCRIFSLDTVGSDSAARARFNGWLKHFSIGGYFVDASMDMSYDYSQERIIVPPTLKNRSILLGSACKELSESLKATKSVPLIYALGKTATATLRESRRAD